MTVKWEKTGPNVGVLEVEVPPEQVDTALSTAFKKVANRVNVPGFRRGKVPRKIFEARFGVESLYQDALDILLPEAYSNAVLEADFQPVDRPDINVVQMEVGKPLVFKATVTLRPEVRLGEYKGLTYEDRPFDVTEEAIEEELERIRQGHAELHVVEDGEVQRGDLVVIDFRGFVDGEPFEGGEAENYQLEIGSGTFVGGFEDQLIGARPGDEREIEVTFPDSYHVKSLAGKQARFEVKVHDLKRKVLPALDDEFAKDVSEYETFAEFREQVVKDLEHRAEHEKEHYIENSLVQKIVDQSEIDIPQVMIDAEIEAQIREFSSRLETQGIPLDAYREFTGTSMEELHAQFAPEAERRVRRSLVLEAVAKSENLEVTPEELDLEVQRVADSIRMDFAQVRAALESRDLGLSSMRSELLARKAVALLVENGVRA